MGSSLMQSWAVVFMRQRELGPHSLPCNGDSELSPARLLSQLPVQKGSLPREPGSIKALCASQPHYKSIETNCALQAQSPANKAGLFTSRGAGPAGRWALFYSVFQRLPLPPPGRPTRSPQPVVSGNIPPRHVSLVPRSTIPVSGRVFLPGLHASLWPDEFLEWPERGPPAPVLCDFTFSHRNE